MLKQVAINATEDISLNSVGIVIGMTKDTDKVLQSTIPTTLIPGVNLVGAANLIVRQHMSSNIFGLGLIDGVRIFLYFFFAISVTNLICRPEIPTSSLK